MCRNTASWKREQVPDHKFDFIDTREFTDNGFGMRMKYLWLYVIVLKSFLVYVSDIFTLITMLSTDSWANEIFNNCGQISGCVAIPFDVGRWLFFGCIIFSFLLVAYETHKAKKIIVSRDISYAFTNVMANNYYSLRSYDHFCFFDHISNSTKTSDDFVFFVFFTFKSWKRLILADSPRQTINALTLYSIYLAKRTDERDWWQVEKYFDGNSISTSVITVTTLFTVLICAGSLLILLAAAIAYIPLLYHIQGNLKEYCCHKVDKRIDAVIKRRQKQRLADARKQAKKEAEGDFSHLKNKKGELMAKPLPQPTLPNVSVDDTDDMSSIRTRTPAPSAFTADQSYYYHSDVKSSDYPPMPGYNPYSNVYNQYNPSQQTFGADDYYNSPNHGVYHENDDYEHLTGGAAPMGRAAGTATPQPMHDINRPGSTRPNPHDQYYQGATSDAYPPSRTPPPPFTSQTYGSAQDPYAQDPYAYQHHQPDYHQQQDWSHYHQQQQPQHRDGGGGGHGHAM